MTSQNVIDQLVEENKKLETQNAELQNYYHHLKDAFKKISENEQRLQRENSLIKEKLVQLTAALARRVHPLQSKLDRAVKALEWAHVVIDEHVGQTLADKIFEALAEIKEGK
jgi:CHASE3 domain sensor protein